MTTSSSSAAEKTLHMKIWNQFANFFAMLLIFDYLFNFNYEENNTYIFKTLEIKGSVKEGDNVLK